MDAKLEVPTTSNSIVNIATKMAAIMQAIGWLEKESEVQMGGRTAYAYTSEAQFIAEVRPLMVEFGVLMLPVDVKIDVMEKSGDKPSFLTTITVTYRFIDSETGEYIDLEVVGQGADATDKGVYKALTGAYKYCMRQTFMIGTGDDPEATDEDGRVVSHPKAGQKSKSTQMQRMITQAKTKGVDLTDEPYASLWKQLNVDLDEVGSSKQDKEFMASVQAMVKSVIGGDVKPEDAVKSFKIGD